MNRLLSDAVVKRVNQSARQPPAAEAHNIARVAAMIGTQHNLSTCIPAKQGEHFGGKVRGGAIDSDGWLLVHSQIYRQDLINLDDKGW